MVYCDQNAINCFGVRDDLLATPASAFLTPAMFYRVPRYTSKHCGFFKPPAVAGRQFVEVCVPNCDQNAGRHFPAPTW